MTKNNSTLIYLEKKFFFLCSNWIISPRILVSYPRILVSYPPPQLTGKDLVPYFCSFTARGSISLMFTEYHTYSINAYIAFLLIREPTRAFNPENEKLITIIDNCHMLCVWKFLNVNVLFFYLYSIMNAYVYSMSRG